MNKRWLVNGSLALLLTLLVIVALNEPGKPELVPPTKLTALRADQVTHISVIKADLPNIELEKVENRWQLRSPTAAGKAAQSMPGNPFRIDSIVKLVEADSYLQLHPTATNLQQYGLAPPHVSARLNNVEIAFGNTDPIKGWRYVRLGDTVHAIANTQYSQLLGEPLDFVNSELLPGQPDIKALKLPTAAINKASTGAWKVEPQPTDYSADAVTKLVDEWRYARALSLSPLEPAPSQGQIVVELKQGASVRFDILARKPKLLLGNNELGLTYKFAADVGDRLLDLSKHKPSE